MKGSTQRRALTCAMLAAVTGGCATDAPVVVPCSEQNMMPFVVIVSDAQTGKRWPFYNVVIRASIVGMPTSITIADSIVGPKAAWVVYHGMDVSGPGSDSLGAGFPGAFGWYAVEVTADGYRPWRTAAFRTLDPNTCPVHPAVLEVRMTPDPTRP